jgi:hypothetical protein
VALAAYLASRHAGLLAQETERTISLAMIDTPLSEVMNMLSS